MPGSSRGTAGPTRPTGTAGPTRTTGPIGPIRTARTTRTGSAVSMLSAFNPTNIPSASEMREIEEMNNITYRELSEDEEKVFNMWLDTESQGNGSQMASLGFDVSSQPTTTVLDHKLDGTAGVLDGFYITLMNNLHEYFDPDKVYSLNDIILNTWGDYNITVDINDRERFVLKFFHEDIEKFHFSVFTRGGVYRGLHITNPTTTTKKHMYIGHRYFEDSLYRGDFADIDFFAKTLTTIGYYIETRKSVKDPRNPANRAIIRFIYRLLLSPKEKNDFAEILKFIGRNYRGSGNIQPGGRVLNSYKSKELKINIIK
jgi:hypothetical protein